MKSLKARLAAKEPLLGTFLKTPSIHICEVLARTDLDLICIDAEHAPFDRANIDACLLALRAGGLPAIVRVPSKAAHDTLNALDCGAQGVLVPHVIEQADARRAVDNAHYGRSRGYAGSSRSAGYMAKTMEQQVSSGAESVVVAQIEDAAALTQLDALFAVDGVDAFFIGRADLTVSLGETDMGASRVVEAAEEICNRGRASGKTLGLFTNDLTEIGAWRQRGVSLFLLSSDHAMMLNGAKALSQTVRAAF